MKVTDDGTTNPLTRRHPAVERMMQLEAEIERLKAALRDVVSALDTLGIDGWSEAPHLMRVCRAALEGK